MMISITEALMCAAGITAFWVLKYSAEKDRFDEQDKSFSAKQWFIKWFKKRNDNVLAHVVLSYIILFMGVDNLEAWMGDKLTIPKGTDELGASVFIGFAGSYIVNILKKGI